MIPARPSSAYVSVVAGLGLAIVLVQFFPVMPAKEVRAFAPLPKELPVEDVAVSPWAPTTSEGTGGASAHLYGLRPMERSATPPPTIRRSTSGTMPFVAELPPVALDFAERAVPRPRPPKAVTSGRPGSASIPVLSGARPSVETAPSPVPALKKEVEMPMPALIAPPVSRPVAIRARISDTLNFKSKILDVVNRHSANISFDGSSVHIRASAAGRDALKSDIEMFIFDYLSDEGTDIRIEITAH